MLIRRMLCELFLDQTNRRERVFLRNYRASIIAAGLIVLAVFYAFSGSGRSSSIDPVGAVQGKKDEFCEHPPYHYFKGKPVECTCASPALPEAWWDNEGWEAQHDRMVQWASTSKDLDLVLLGDSITERINGTKSLGRKQLPENRQVFEAHMGSLHAIALGSSGDTSNNLLWHLNNGILPDASLQPKVWWILIGTNNMGRTGCNPQSTLDGILSVLHSLQQKRPTAKIILHGLLPRSERAMEEDDDYQMGVYWENIQWINQRLKEACKENCVYMEANDLFLAPGDKVNPVTLTDGLHPSTEGLQQWLPRIVSQVENLMN